MAGTCANVMCRRSVDTMWWVVVACVLMFAGAISAFNLDTASAVVHRGTTDDMFGFSVALYKDKGSSPWLLVGAPRTQTGQHNVTSGGAVFKCGTDAVTGCSEVPFDTRGDGIASLYYHDKKRELKSNQWFGATVQTSAENDVVVACAPRYVSTSVNYERREPVGNCWIARNGMSVFEEYSPCRTTSNWGFHRQGYCQAGMSAALTENGKMLFVGAVGSWYWQGEVFSRDLSANYTEYHTAESPATYDDSFLGYSSAVGEFSGDADADVAVGMPRGANLTGKVVLFNSSLHNLRNISGEQLGSYFGYSVCVSDVNGDGLDDIVVGAPFFIDLQSKESKYEEGRVYVFHQDHKHEFHELQTLDGEFAKGRFGQALASLKDINRDGYQDFAVGAPYAGKDGKGILYVYHGSPAGIREKPSQVITPEDFKDVGLNTLGFAVSGGVDMDSNEYPDIVIGAYDSDRIVFMRSRPVVNMTSSMKLSKDVINLEDRTCTLKGRDDKTKVACIEATFCLVYNGLGVAPEIDITYTFTLDAAQKRSRANFMSTHQFQDSHTIRLRKDTKYCNTSSLYIQNGIRDKLSSIEMRAEYRLLDLEPYRHVLKPIINMNVPSAASKQLNIEKNCGKDDICIPDLQLLVVSNMDQYSIGNKKRLELDVTIRNAGEDAFESMFYVAMPLDVHYVNIDKANLDFPVSCSGAQPEITGVNELQCDIGNPLPVNKTLNFKILLEPSRVVTSTTDLIFSMVVNSTNAEKNETLFNNEFEIELPVRVEVSLAVKGQSQPPFITHDKSEELPETKVRETDIGPEVTHAYIVGNLGPSSIKQAEVHILWPTYTLDGQPLLYLVAQPDVQGNAECQTVKDVNPRELQEIRRRPRNQIPGELHNPDGNGTDTSLMRVRKEAEVEDFMSDEGEDRFLNDATGGTFEDELSCGATLCTHIQCSIYNLEKEDQVAFFIRSRLWRETYNELGLSRVTTSSKLVARITSLPYGVDPSYLPYKVDEVSTLVNIQDGDYRPYVVAWWIIILAVCLGLLLLALLALLLWKLGFFKRKRPEEQPEKEPLNDRNGYRMARGDAAL